MRPVRGALGVGALLAGVLIPATAPNPSVAAADTTATAVSGVELRWGLNNETNNAGFAPGTYNLLSAGKIGNPGKGGAKLTDKSNGQKWNNNKSAGWSASSGNVTIVKNHASGTKVATWGDFKFDARGREIQSPTDNRFSDHEVVISSGDGWVDTDDGRAKIRWDGDFTVLYYSGMTFYYVSDPELNIGADGTGQLTATLDGYGSSRFDMSVWKPIPERRVVLADLAGVDLASGTAKVTPSYKGVRVQVDSPGVPQVRSGKNWGAWPQSFVDYQQRTGQGPYWYSSGGSTDVHKVQLPVSIGETAFGADVTVPAGDPRDKTLPDDNDGGDNGGNDGGDDGNDNGNGNGGDDNGGGNDGDNNGGDGGDDNGANEPFAVDNAEFRWGINRESNNAGFAPGTHNFFSAGKIDDPGQGGQTITRDDWSAKAGNVTIEKLGPEGSYGTATWAGLTTTADGDDVAAPTDGLFSGHQIVIDGGEGRIDPRRGTARISWDGDFTVLYYSGMTFFYVSDPTLVIRNGRGTVKATLGGFATSRNDTSVWKPLPDRRVTIADLGRVDLGDAGFTDEPRYLGVRYDAPKSIAPQHTGDAFGSFPSAFVDYQVRTGQASYWYSSGGQTDAYKVPLPMTVSYDADNAVDPPDDKTSPDEDPTDDPPDKDPTPERDEDPSPDPDEDGDDTGRDAPGSFDTDDVADDTAIAASPLSTTHSADQPEARAVSANTPEHTWMWWLGGGLLAIAAALTFTTSLLTQRQSRKS